MLALDQRAERRGSGLDHTVVGADVQRAHTGADALQRCSTEVAIGTTFALEGV
jgi:hypothetical protein